MSVEINVTLFWARLKRLYASWMRSPHWGGENGVDSIMLCYGKSDEEAVYARWLSAVQYLFGYESQSTIIVFTKTAVHLLMSPKKIKVFQPLQSDAEDIKIHFHARQKRVDPAPLFQEIVNAMKASGEGKRVGYIKKQPIEGKLTTAFMEAVDTAGLEKVDVTIGWAMVTHTFSQSGVNQAKLAAEITTAVHKKAKSRILQIVEDEQKVKHSLLADDLDILMSDFETKKKTLKLKNLAKIDAEEVETCYTPIIMSGGDYDLRPSAVSNDVDLDYGTIIIECAARYQGICTNAARTIFFNPTETQEQVYMLLLLVYQECVKRLRPGTKMNEVYEAAIKIIKRKKPELVSKFGRDCGSGIGFEFRNSSMVLNARNHRTIKKGMIFNLALGFSGLHVEGRHAEVKKTTKTRSVFAVLLADTLLVTDEEPEVLTHIKRSLESYTSSTGDSSDDSEDRAVLEVDTRVRGVTRDRLRERLDGGEGKKRQENQSFLAERKREEALASLAKEKMKKTFNKDKKEADRFMAYADVGSFPSGLPEHKMYVDVVNEAVLCPVGQSLIPIHVRLIKNINKNDDGKHTELRIGFHTPEGVSKDKLPSFAEFKSFFLRELSYRSTSTSLANSFFDIKELRKEYAARQREQADRKSLVVQPDLVVDRSTGAVGKLRDVSFRPNIGRNKKAKGVLSLHVNGFRYVSFSKERVDIIYANVKSCFFQPADAKTANSTLHFQLKSPILIGKKKPKKTTWVQFFVEVIDSAHDVDTRGYHDDDGLAEAQQERLNRKRWNDRFKNFGKKMQDHVRKQGGDLEFDIPHRKLGFKGKANRQQVMLYPSNHSLIALDDEPPVVIGLKDIEIAVFERVRFSLRSFDLTIVYKDFSKMPSTIYTVDSKQLEQIKAWLNQQSILYYEKSDSFQWKQTMAHIRKDIEGFYQDGGWSSWFGEMEPEEGAGAAEPSEDDDDVYVPSDDDEDDDEFESDEDEVSESDDEEWDSGSGDDWEEMERKAKSSDNRKREGSDMSDEERPARKKRR